MKLKLTKKELEVMQLLWSSEEPLSITDFIERNPKLVTSTVQAALRSLLKKTYIKVADIVQHNKVYARTYTPILTEREYIMENFNASALIPGSFLAALINNEDNPNTLDELERLIKKQKEKIENGELHQ